jgi:hypothetical protein
MLGRMKTTMLLSLVLLAACDSGPTETESIQVFGTATQEMSIALDRATVGISGTTTTIDYSGGCASGGTFSITGAYQGQVFSEDRAAFDLTTTFDHCGNAGNALDGSLHWTSVIDRSAYDATMIGDLSASGPNLDVSCAFDLHMLVDSAVIAYSGSICGYDLNADLNIHTGT